MKSVKERSYVCRGFDLCLALSFRHSVFVESGLTITGKKSDAFSGPDAAVSHGRLETRGISGAAVNNFVHEFPGSVAVQVGCWKP